MYRTIPCLRLPYAMRIMAFVVVLAPGTLSAQSPNFSARRDTEVSRKPISIAAADLNNDGAVDMAVVNSGSSTITLLKGSSTGFFHSAGVLTAGTTPERVVIADLNGDGNPDLAVTNSGSGNVSVFLANGNLTFQPAVNYGAGNTPLAIAVADVNNDGKLDLIVTNNEAEGTVSVLLGNGDGTFHSPVSSPAGASNPVSIALGDFNGDGKLDAAIADRLAGDVFILLGNGDGTFQPPSLLVVGGGPASVVTADFNGDGKLDLAVAGSFFNDVYVLLGNGDGTFQPKTSYTADSGPLSLAVGDFNGDGKLDLAVADNLGNDIAVLLGNGDGTFQPATLWTTGAGPGSLVVASFHSASTSDLAVANSGTAAVSVFFSNNDGTFQTAPSYAAGVTSPQSIASADFNGDGKLDVATWSSSYSNQAVTILLGNGDATFGTPISIPLQKSYPNGFESLGLGDFNGDGKLDLVLAGSTNTLLLLQNTVALTPSALAFGNQSTGTTSAPQTLTLSNIGTSSLGVGAITITGNRGFSQTNTCNGSVAAGSSCSIMVVFAPTSGGSKTGSISVGYQGLGSPATAGLTGTGVNAASASLTPAVLKFPTEMIGAVSQAQTATLTNTGTLSVSVSSIMASGAFTETNNCPSTLTQGENCQIQVQFKASARGSQLGQLTVTDSAVNSPQSIKLSGTGTVVQLSATGVNFGNQKVGTSSASVTVKLTNEGTVPLSITQISITGVNATDFSQSNNCGAGIAAGATCSISVTFTPLATGVRTAAVSISDNGGASPQTVSLTGTGD